ncbi:MAG: Gldg family protein [Phycisphaerales bacterium]|nr:Gldg family protein [Phycisphaerales bacterium]
MNTKVFGIGGLLLLVALFFGINILAGRAAKSARLDLTSQNLYTLTDGSRNIAKSLDEPIKLTLYLSDKAMQGRPGLITYAQRVREMLEEFSAISAGKIALNVVDPVAFSEDEDRANEAGVRGLPVSASESVYFGLVGTNATDGKEIIPIFDPTAERFLEYDIARTIYSLAHPKKKVVGLMSTLPVEGLPFDPLTGQPSRQQPWQVIKELKGLFEVRNVPTTATEIPADVDLLMLIHPKQLGDATLYAIDQHVMKGGKLLVFVDPMCEADPSGADPRNPMAAMMADRSSSLGKVFDSWGLELVPGKIAGDRVFATQVTMRGQGQAIPFLAWQSVTKDGIDRADPTTGQLTSINLGTPGILRLKSEEKKEEPKPEEKKDETKKDDAKPEEAKKEGDAKADEQKPDENKAAETKQADSKPAAKPIIVISPLIHTTTQSQEIDAMQVAAMPDPKRLLNDFKPSGQEFTMAARLSLTPGAALRSAFPGGKPAPAEGQAPADPKAGHVDETKGPINVVVVADVDFMNDRFWVQIDQMFGMARKIADNGDFVVNLVDNLCGSADLLSVRARGEFARPFTRVEELQRKADDKFRAREQELQQQIQLTQDRISELQRKRPDAKEESAMILSPEQKVEIDKLEKQVFDARKELRQVQLNLRSDIDSLEAKLKFINIGAMPVVVALAALAIGGFRAARRSGQKKTGSAA